MSRQAPTALGGIIFLFTMFAIGCYFSFAAVQGDYGVFRLVQIKAEIATLQEEKAKLETELAALSNRTHRPERFWDMCARTRLSSADFLFFGA
jgi:hypothetical protein